MDNGIHSNPTKVMIKSFSFSLDSDFDVEEITNMENITYDECNGIIFKLIEDHHINCGERTEGSVTFDDGVTPIIYNVDYRFCLEVGEDWDSDVWDEFEVNVQL